MCVVVFDGQDINQAVGFAKGEARRNAESTKPKIAVFAPMPSARVRTATVVKPGDLRNRRKLKRASEKSKWSQVGMRCSASIG